MGIGRVSGSLGRGSDNRVIGDGCSIVTVVEMHKGRTNQVKIRRLMR